MQQTVIATPMAAPVTIVQPPTSVRNIAAIRGLGIASIVIGSITFIIGIVVVAVVKDHWTTNTGAGIWCGAWIIITGILGVLSARRPANGTLNGFNMSFNIITTIITFLDGIFFIVAVAYFRTCDGPYRYGYSYYSYYGRYSYYYRYRSGCTKKDEGVGLYSVLVICMVAEWFVALFAAVYCCSGGCCGRQPSSGVIVQQSQPQMQVITSTVGQQHVISSGQPMMMATGQPMMTSSHYPAMSQPGVSYPYGHTSAYNAPSQGQPPAQSNAPMPGHTNVAYSEQEQHGQMQKGVPPPYFS